MTKETMAADSSELKDVKLNEKVKPGKPVAKKKSMWLSFLMNFVTLGIWSRFRPRRGGWNGTWGLTVVFLLIIVTGLVGERFFKKEINTELKTALNVEENILPEQWAFETAKLAHDEEITKLKSQVQELKAKLADAQSATASVSNEEFTVDSQNVDADGLFAELKLQLVAANQQIKELTENPPVMKYVDKSDSAVPMIKLQSFEAVDAIVGCKSRFSDERQLDVFGESYNDHWLQWSGEIKHVDNESVTIGLGDTSTLNATFETEGAGYELLKGDKLTITFKLSGKGNCDSAYSGSNAVIIK